MLTYASVVAVLVTAFLASLGVERAFGRSRKEMRKPGWFIVFFLLFAPSIYLVYAMVPVQSDLLYAAYASAGGLAALVAQCLFGAELSPPSSARAPDA